MGKRTIRRVALALMLATGVQASSRAPMPSATHRNWHKSKSRKGHGPKAWRQPKGDIVGPTKLGRWLGMK
jgi:hypothetical protein